MGETSSRRRTGRPPKEITGQVRAVDGPLERNGKYRVEVATWGGGRNKRQFSDELEAKRFADEWRTQIVDQPDMSACDVRDPDGTTQWWQDTLQRAAHRLLTLTKPLERRELARDLVAVAKAGQSFRGLTDLTELEQRLKSIEAQLEAEATEEREGYGARDSSPTDAGEVSTAGN